MKELLVRGSASTGFRAPSLYDMNAPQTYTNTANNWDDPVRCPGGVPIAGVSKSDNCAVQFMSLIGGNKNLQPEKSKNWTVGLVFEPVADVNAGVDFWWIRLSSRSVPCLTPRYSAIRPSMRPLPPRAATDRWRATVSLCPGCQLRLHRGHHDEPGRCRTRTASTWAPTIGFALVELGFHVQLQRHLRDEVTSIRTKREAPGSRTLASTAAAWH